MLKILQCMMYFFISLVCWNHILGAIIDEREENKYKKTIVEIELAFYNNEICYSQYKYLLEVAEVLPCKTIIEMLEDGKPYALDDCHYYDYLIRLNETQPIYTDE